MTIAALILAAGRSSRMGARNKLLADLGGKPLIARTVANVVASRARPIVLVTGHMAEAVREAAGDSSIAIAHNRDFTDGMASSLRAGLAAAPADAEGALVMLGDMPLIGADILDRLIAEAAARPSASAIVPTVDGEWAHPVLLRRILFDEAMALTGDAGARRILRERGDVATLAIDEPALLMDADDAEALARLREEWSRRP